MNKHFFTFVAAMLMLFFTNKSAFATDQYPDYIIINGEKFELYVDWSFPSPLQTYFNRTGIECPFRMWSTANYRGHIATWTVRDSALYLTQIDTRRQYGRTGTYLPNTHKPLDTIASPSYFGIQSLGYQAADGEGNVLADWFTGTIIAQRYLDPKDQEILYDDNSSKREKQKAKKRLIKQRKQNESNFEAPTPFAHTVELAKPYINLGVKMGEGWLLVAEMIEHIDRGTTNIVITQPFGCLPNHIVGKGVMKIVKDRNPGVNLIAIDYDASASEINQQNRIKLLLANANKEK